MKPPTVADLEAVMLAASASGNHPEADRIGRLLDTTPRPHPTLLGAALWYATHGMRVFPLQPGHKTPLRGSRGCHDATNNPDQIRAWWTRTPTANIGLATGHVYDVIDIDGPGGNTSLARDVLTDTVTLHRPYDGCPPVHGTVSTPRPGGRHLYVAATGRGNTAGAGSAGGLDYRGLGGYVVAPPSATHLGVYRWLRPLTHPTPQDGPE